MKKMFNEGNQIHNFMSSSGSGTVLRMYALFFHRLSILERATDHKCIEECSYSKRISRIYKNSVVEPEPEP